MRVGGVTCGRAASCCWHFTKGSKANFSLEMTLGFSAMKKPKGRRPALPEGHQSPVQVPKGGPAGASASSVLGLAPRSDGSASAPPQPPGGPSCPPGRGHTVHPLRVILAGCRDMAFSDSGFGDSSFCLWPRADLAEFEPDALDPCRPGSGPARTDYAGLLDT